MNVNEYRYVLHEDIALSSTANATMPEEEFLDYVTKILIDAEEFDDFTECYYEGVTHRHRAKMQIDGYTIDDVDGSCCVFIEDYRGAYDDDSIRADDINSSFNKVRHFVEEAIDTELYQELEESSEIYEFARDLYYDNGNVTKFRFYLLTDAFNKQRKKNIKDTSIAGKIVELNVWDITRIYELVNSKTQKESVEINLSEYSISDMPYEGIPCVKAVECKDAVADIEVTPKYDEELGEDVIPDNHITYTSYLAVIPGQILNDLYLEYGAKLLEGNVRSFLSVRGKVNKGIQNTIKNYPEMFFAYNNGIAATASEMDTKMTAEGLKITKIKDLQIVNGGQTTASITNTLLSERKGEHIDISNLYVPMKISVLDHSMSEKIIPKISEYSNSQNKVDASDFFSNHPFHIRMEKISRTTPAPAVHGNQYQQYWFYERARGQYNQGKMKFKAKSSELKQYQTKYPEKQVIKLVDLARYMELYECAPDVVSKGKQALVKTFAGEIKVQWEKSNVEFNDYYYKRVVALAILFKKTDNIIKNSDWYLKKRSYKANVVAYSIAVLFDYIRKNRRGYDLDFMRIWNEQDLYYELTMQMRSLTDEVYRFITSDDRLTENVTQWCKKQECWKRAQRKTWTIYTDFLDTLIPIAEIKEEQKQAKEERKVDNEVDDLKYIITMGSDYWKKVYEWGKTRRLLSDMEISILHRTITMNVTGRIPTAKQAKVLLRTRDRLIQDGMPMQFNNIIERVSI